MLGELRATREASLGHPHPQIVIPFIRRTVCAEDFMKIAIWSAGLVLAAGFLWAQSDHSGNSNQPSNSNHPGPVTVRGCVSILNGDYVLMKENPGNTYQLQGNKTKLKSYLGKRVQITGTESPTLSTSEDSINRGGNASPVTLTVKSIKTIAGECENR
jgi:hypothetical protein